MPPPVKRRRAKRTEDERIEYLRTDPYVAHFEPYRVLCASCDKWIRLRPNSTYCSIPWDAHRKSCLAKKASVPALSSLSPLFSLTSFHSGTRHAGPFAGDPTVKKVDAGRVHCRTCNRWVDVGTDEPAAATAWAKHRTSCDPPSAAGATTGAASRCRLVSFISVHLSPPANLICSSRLASRPRPSTSLHSPPCPPPLPPAQLRPHPHPHRLLMPLRPTRPKQPSQQTSSPPPLTIRSPVAAKSHAGEMQTNVPPCSVMILCWQM
jgi:hypothetical protein